MINCTKIIQYSIFMICGVLIGIILTMQFVRHMNATYPSFIQCVEHVTVDNRPQCIVFTYQGVTYATPNAPRIHND